MNQMELAQYCLDINALTADKIIAQFRELERDAARVKRLIKKKIQASQDALNEQYRIICRQICGEDF